MKMDLDDVDVLYKLDKSRAISNVLSYPEACLQAYKLEPINLPEVITSPRIIVIAGMGGSGISGDIVATWLQDRIKIPIISVKDYILPNYVDEDALVVLVSYSGNTEETLSVFSQALERKAQVLAVTSNGKLEEYCQKARLPFIRIPSGYQPREAIIYLTIPIASFLEKTEIIENLSMEIRSTAEVLQQVREQIKPEVPLEENPAKKIAVQILNTTPIIYGSGIQNPIAYRMKCQLNENSKVHAFYGVIPEMNHNEIMGWEHVAYKMFSVIFLRYHSEREEVKTRIEILKNLLSERGVTKVLEIWARGKSTLEKMFSTMFIGDMTTLYLAFLRNVDPLKIELIEKLKKELERKGTKQKILQKLLAIIEKENKITFSRKV